MEPKPIPKVSLTIGAWSLVMETSRMRLRTLRMVHLSDNATGFGKGTLLRTERRSCDMTIHACILKHAKGGGYIIQITTKGSKVSVTKRNLDPGVDIDGKPLKVKVETYTMAKAESFFARTLRMDPAKVRKLILTPLPEKTDVGEHSDVTTPDTVGV
jgi:hypothetical protein